MQEEKESKEVYICAPGKAPCYKHFGCIFGSRDGLSEDDLCFLTTHEEYAIKNSEGKPVKYNG